MKRLIVSHRGALHAKYGDTGLNEIEAALGRWATSDAALGLESVLAYLDDASLGRARARRADDAKACKRALDRLLSKAGTVDYLLLLGAPDVIPHQPLANPLPVGLREHDDPDPIVWSDLPYASERPASTRIQDFLGPTRAVGRLPDEVSGRDPAVLVARIDQAAAARPARAVGTRFALSAQVWREATREVLRRSFGRATAVRLSPPQNAPVPARVLGAPLQLINCHGAPSDPTFYGDDGRHMPRALAARDLPARARPGTVVAAECCYGAELYAAQGVAPGIASTFLTAGALGYLGSTTVSYGAFDAGLEAADLICARFLELVAQGASLGRALLEARLDFARSAQPWSGIELKTMAQFTLLGDPAARAVAPDPAASRARGSAGDRGRRKSARGGAGAAKTQLARLHERHRLELVRAGRALCAWADKRRLKTRRITRPRAAGASQEVEAHASGTACLFTWVPTDDPNAAAKSGAESAAKSPPQSAPESAVVQFRPPVVGDATPGKRAKGARAASRKRARGPRRSHVVITRLRRGEVVEVVHLARR